jgi:hypothetical protein
VWRGFGRSAYRAHASADGSVAEAWCAVPPARGSGRGSLPQLQDKAKV